MLMHISQRLCHSECMVRHTLHRAKSDLLQTVVYCSAYVDQIQQHCVLQVGPQTCRKSDAIDWIKPLYY